MTAVVTSHQPVTVNGAVDIDPLLSGQGIEEGTGVSIELPLAALRTNPPNGEADG